jgi:hypothetical protein
VRVTAPRRSRETHFAPWLPPSLRHLAGRPRRHVLGAGPPRRCPARRAGDGRDACFALRRWGGGEARGKPPICRSQPATPALTVREMVTIAITHGRAPAGLLVRIEGRAGPVSWGLSRTPTSQVCADGAGIRVSEVPSRHACRGPGFPALGRAEEQVLSWPFESSPRASRDAMGSKTATCAAVRADS